MKKNKTVLVSFSGGMKSLVTAYILKKQGYLVSGAYIKIPSLDGNSFSLRSTCHQNNEERIKQYCDLLEISLVEIDGADYYNEFVIKRLIAAKLAGETFVPCVYCNQIRTELLIKKADELNIYLVATGHMAQVTKNLKENSYRVSKALDITNDQSYFLTGLDSLQLARIIFPLGKLHLPEIEKIANSLNGQKANKTVQKICLMDGEFLPDYIDSQVAKKLRPKGDLIEYFKGLSFGEHDGIHRYKLGQKHVKTKFSEIDSTFEVVAIDPNKHEIKLAKNWKYEVKFLMLRDFRPYINLDLTRPIKCQVALGPGEKLITGILYPKNNACAHVEFDKSIKRALAIGTHVVLYLNNKVIGSGTIQTCYKDGPRLPIPFQF